MLISDADADADEIDSWILHYIVLFEQTIYINRIWRATIHIESHLKSDDFISSRIWRATISYRVAFEERRFHIESQVA